MALVIGDSTQSSRSFVAMRVSQPSIVRVVAATSSSAISLGRSSRNMSHAPHPDGTKSGNIQHSPKLPFSPAPSPLNPKPAINTSPQYRPTIPGFAPSSSTPAKYNLINPLLTPPDSSERVNNKYLEPPRPSSSPSPSPLLPLLRQPSLPRITNLTPSTLRDLSQLTDAYFTLPCSASQFDQFYDRYRRQLEQDFRLWEYDARNQEFIIKCMPTPIHEDAIHHANFKWGIGLSQTVGVDPSGKGWRGGIKVYTNNDIKIHDGNDGAFSTRVPDLTTCVVPHSSANEDEEEETEPSTNKTPIYAIVFEVGFTQKLPSLVSRARMWLENAETGTHLVVLIHIHETPLEYATKDGKKVTRSKAKRDEATSGWAIWFGGKTPWEEVHRRGADSEKALGRVKKTLIEELAQRLKVADGQGNLVPALLEPLDAAVYVYRRKPGYMVGESALGEEQDNREEAQAEDEGEDEEEGDSTEDEEQDHNEEEEEEEEEEEDEETHAAESFIERILPDNWSSESSETSSSISLATDANLSDDDISSTTTTTTTTTTSSTRTTKSPSPSLPAPASIELIYTHALLSASIPVPDLATQRLQFSIAELYGPLPVPTQSLVAAGEATLLAIPAEVLARMPPSIRGAARERIVLPLQHLAGALVEDSVDAMRARRAVGRARRIVEGVWPGVLADWQRKRGEVDVGGKRAGEAEERIERGVRREERSKRRLDGEEGGEGSKGGLGDGEGERDVERMGRRRGTAEGGGHLKQMNKKQKQ